MRRIPTRRNISGLFAADTDQTRGIALVNGQIRKGGGELSSQVESTTGGDLKCHRFAAIQYDVKAQVRFSLELLHVKAIRSTEHAPIEAAQIIAWNIVAVFGEFHAGAA